MNLAVNLPFYAYLVERGVINYNAPWIFVSVYIILDLLLYDIDNFAEILLS